MREIDYDAFAPETDAKEIAAAQHGEYEKLKRRFWLPAILSAPVLLIAMSHGAIGFLNFAGVNWLQLILTVPVVFYCGSQFYRAAFADLKHGAADMNTLVALGTGAAFVCSSLATIFPAVFSAANGMPEINSETMSAPIYFEAASVIIALVLLGRMLESRAKNQTGEAIKRLAGLQPKTARVVRNATEVDVAIEEVLVGDTIIVRPGEKIPVDGMVLEGSFPR